MLSRIREKIMPENTGDTEVLDERAQEIVDRMQKGRWKRSFGDWKMQLMYTTYIVLAYVLCYNWLLGPDGAVFDILLFQIFVLIVFGASTVLRIIAEVTRKPKIVTWGGRMVGLMSFAGYGFVIYLIWKLIIMSCLFMCIRNGRDHWAWRETTCRGTPTRLINPPEPWWSFFSYDESPHGLPTWDLKEPVGFQDSTLNKIEAISDNTFRVTEAGEAYLYDFPAPATFDGLHFTYQTKLSGTSDMTPNVLLWIRDASDKSEGSWNDEDANKVPWSLPVLKNTTFNQADYENEIQDKATEFYGKLFPYDGIIDWDPAQQKIDIKFEFFTGCHEVKDDALNAETCDGQWNEVSKTCRKCDEFLMKFNIMETCSVLEVTPIRNFGEEFWVTTTTTTKKAIGLFDPEDAQNSPWLGEGLAFIFIILFQSFFTLVMGYLNDSAAQRITQDNKKLASAIRRAQRESKRQAGQSMSNSLNTSQALNASQPLNQSGGVRFADEAPPIQIGGGEIPADSMEARALADQEAAALADQEAQAAAAALADQGVVQEREQI